MTAYVEVTLSWLFKNAKGHDAKSFHTRKAFANHKEPTITVTSPDCGESPAKLGPAYIAEGGGRIPSLEWKAPDEIASQVKEWLLVVEDLDAPLPTPIAHGIYGGIAPGKTKVAAEDFEIQDEGKFLLKGGFHYGKNLRGVVYVPPRPLLNHGAHRYFFHIIALDAQLDKEILAAKASRDQVADAIDGKVLAWGLWIGSCERNWT